MPLGSELHFVGAKRVEPPESSDAFGAKRVVSGEFLIVGFGTADSSSAGPFFPECLHRKLWVFSLPLFPSHPHEVRSIFHRAADSDADAPTGQWLVAATWSDEPTDNFTNPGRVEPGAAETRRQSDDTVFGSLPGPR